MFRVKSLPLKVPFSLPPFAIPIKTRFYNKTFFLRPLDLTHIAYDVPSGVNCLLLQFSSAWLDKHAPSRLLFPSQPIRIILLRSSYQAAGRFSSLVLQGRCSWYFYIKRIIKLVVCVCGRNKKDGSPMCQRDICQPFLIYFFILPSDFISIQRPLSLRVFSKSLLIHAEWAEYCLYSIEHTY